MLGLQSCHMVEIVIPLSKNRLFIGLLIGSGILVLAILWLIGAYRESGFAKNVDTTVGWVGAVCGIVMCLDSVLRLRSSKPGLVIGYEGITYRLNDIGLVKWQDIQAFRIVTHGGTALYTPIFISVMLNNSNEVISRQRGFKKWQLRHSMKFFGSPLVISPFYLECDSNWLYSELDAALQERKTR